jgi:hypothetical protein
VLGEVSPEATVEESIPSPGSGGYQFKILAVNLEDFSIGLLDESAPVPALLGVDDTRLELRNISNEPGALIDLLLEAHIHSGGTLKINGTATIDPVAADISVDLGQVALAVANPYLMPFADVILESGSLSVSANGNLRLGEESPTGSFSGNLHIEDIKAVDSGMAQELVNLSRLGLSGIKAGLNPTALHVEEILLVEPRATVLIGEDGSSNIAQALGIHPAPVEEVEPEVKEAEEAEAKAKPTGLALPFPVSIGSITLKNAGAELTDRSVTPSVNLGVESLSGTISGLSSEELARADLDLAGILVGGTQLAVTGQINPLIADRYSDVEVTFKGFNLTSVSPYSGKFAGYALSKGKLSFDLKYKVSHAELSGENVMVIDQLTLGEKVDSEDALKLPIPLAVSLLKDANGVIEIDIPVSGNLNDPEFSFGRVIGRAFVNILTKLITSPFSMLGGLVGGGEEVDLSLVAFAPGSDALEEEATGKLDLLANALNERPNLKLEIMGAGGGPDEVRELRQGKLNASLMKLRWNELKDIGSTTKLDEIVLTEEERARLLERVFTTVFPDGMAQRGEPVEVEPTAETPPEGGSSTGEAPETGKAKGLRKFITVLFGGSGKTQEPDSAMFSETAPTEPEALKKATPELTTVQMESRILETIKISGDDLHQLAGSRAETVHTYLGQTSGIAAERLFIVKAEEAEAVHPTTGEAKVIFALE